MANIRSNGQIWDGNLVIETGVTITAGSLIWVDISGTNVVRAIRSYSGATAETGPIITGRGIVSLDGQLALQTGVFLGVLANTQTGIPNLSGGHQTGVTWYTKGVFTFNLTVTASAQSLVGMPVYPVSRDTVRCAITGINATPTNATGANPIGVITYLPNSPNGIVTTGSAGGVVRVKIETTRSMQAFA